MKTTKGRGTYWGVLAATLNVAGCGGNSVNLDRNRPGEVTAGAADRDGVVVRKLEGVASVWVDEQRLYWRSGDTLYGCLKSTCASSLVNYYKFDPQPAEPTPPASPDGQLPSSWDTSAQSRAWLASQGDDVVWTTWTSVLSCPRAGCNGAPRKLGTSQPTTNYAVNDKRIVAAALDGIHTMPRAGGDWTLLVQRKSPQFGPIGIRGGYIYWFELNLSVEGGTLVRVPEDGTGSVENVATLAPTAYIPRLAFDSTYVYYTQPREDGGVYRCPLDSCRDGAENALGYAVRTPTALAVDDRGLCVLHIAGGFDAAVSCTAGAAQPLQRRFVHSLEFAMDADYVYAANLRTNQPTESEPIFDISREVR